MSEVKQEQSTRYCRVVILLTPSILERLDKLADKKTMSRSLLIRQACDDLIKQEQVK